MSRSLSSRRYGWLAPLVWLALLLLACLGMEELKGLFRLIEPDSQAVIYARADFLVLLGR
ncbi:osmoprotectant uptake system permease, partial [Halomonas elongata]